MKNSLINNKGNSLLNEKKTKLEVQINMINQITFIYQVVNDICYIQISNQPLQELTIKGTTEQNGVVNGSWFQVDEKVNHSISFKKDKFQANKWEAFYKCVQGEQITYYRRVFYPVAEILTFSFSERDEWVKINGKWQNKLIFI